MFSVLDFITELKNDRMWRLDSVTHLWKRVISFLVGSDLADHPLQTCHACEVQQLKSAPCMCSSLVKQKLDRVYAQLGGFLSCTSVFWCFPPCFSSCGSLNSVLQVLKQQNLASAQVATYWDLPSSKKLLKIEFHPVLVFFWVSASLCLLPAWLFSI